MTKEELIKQAYGEYYDSLKNIIDNDGFSRVIYSFLIGKKDIFEFKKGSFCTDENGITTILVRPKSLQLIEDNAGWIPITKESELPKPGSYVFICRNGEISSVIFKVGHFGRFESEFFDLKKMQATHYKLVEFPTLKPLYDGI
jgi:hypothetical protein